jgi:hypothetical protein
MRPSMKLDPGEIHERSGGSGESFEMAGELGDSADPGEDDLRSAAALLMMFDQL